MNKEKLGQNPAFPLTEYKYTGDGVHEWVSEHGMSKRFYAAAMVLQGLCANPKNVKITSNIFTRIAALFLPDVPIVSKVGNCKDMVKVAYDMADELLRQENI